MSRNIETNFEDQRSSDIDPTLSEDEKSDISQNNKSDISKCVDVKSGNFNETDNKILIVSAPPTDNDYSSNNLFSSEQNFQESPVLIQSPTRKPPPQTQKLLATECTNSFNNFHDFNSFIHRRNADWKVDSSIDNYAIDPNLFKANAIKLSQQTNQINKLKLSQQTHQINKLKLESEIKYKIHQLLEYQKEIARLDELLKTETIVHKDQEHERDEPQTLRESSKGLEGTLQEVARSRIQHVQMQPSQKPTSHEPQQQEQSPKQPSPVPTSHKPQQQEQPPKQPSPVPTSHESQQQMQPLLVQRSQIPLSRTQEPQKDLQLQQLQQYQVQEQEQQRLKKQKVRLSDDTSSSNTISNNTAPRSSSIIATTNESDSDDSSINPNADLYEGNSDITSDGHPCSARWTQEEDELIWIERKKKRKGWINHLHVVLPSRSFEDIEKRWKDVLKYRTPYISGKRRSQNARIFTKYEDDIITEERSKDSTPWENAWIPKVLQRLSHRKYEEILSRWNISLSYRANPVSSTTSGTCTEADTGTSIFEPWTDAEDLILILEYDCDKQSTDKSLDRCIDIIIKQLPHRPKHEILRRWHTVVKARYTRFRNLARSIVFQAEKDLNLAEKKYQIILQGL